MTKKLFTLIGLGLALTVAIGAANASQTASQSKKDGATAKEAAAKPAAVIASQMPFYPMKKCIVSDEPLVAGETEDVVHDGRLVRFCCGGCTKQFKKDPAATIAKLDAAAIRAQKPFYPMEDCIISDEALGSMGDPIELVHNGRLARLCCKGCVRSFQKDPAKYFATIDQGMIAAQLKTYKATTCPVSGEPLGEGTVNHLYGTQLVRTCCKKCAVAVDRNPDKYLVKVASAK